MPTSNIAIPQRFQTIISNIIGHPTGPIDQYCIIALSSLSHSCLVIGKRNNQALSGLSLCKKYSQSLSYLYLNEEWRCHNVLTARDLLCIYGETFRKWK